MLNKNINKLIALFTLVPYIYSIPQKQNCSPPLESCGNACYDPTGYNCFSSGTLCERKLKLCGATSCYDPNVYHCEEENLVLGPEIITASNTSNFPTSTVTSTPSAVPARNCDSTNGSRKFCPIFTDNFDKLNLKTWKHDITLGGGGNWEFQHYTNNRTNSYVRDNTLFIKPTLTMENIGSKLMLEGPDAFSVWGGYGASECTSNDFYGCQRTAGNGQIINPIQSAALRTIDSLTLSFGKIEVKAKLPKGDWIWPAIWLLPKYNQYGQWPASGEIDIMESRGNAPSYPAGGYNSIGSTLHWGTAWDQNKYKLTHSNYTLPNGKTFADDFHTFGLEWTPEYIKTYIDDPSNVVLNVPLSDFNAFKKGGFSNVNNPWINTCPQAPFDYQNEFYLILNVAVGGAQAPNGGYFPDGMGGKPWSSKSGTAAKDFWEGKNQWMPTWDFIGENSAMKVQSVNNLTPSIFPKTWEVLGPFLVGSREIGYDPLSSYGGFENLIYSNESVYFSELVKNGFIKWKKINSNANSSSVGPFHYENVDWDFNRMSLGWSANQHYTYFRSNFEIVHSGVYLLSFTNVISIKVDNEVLLGNMYSYQHAASNPIWLEEGIHNIYLCLNWDIRIFGNGIPAIQFKGSIKNVDVPLENRGVIFFPSDTIVPDIINDKLVTNRFSVTIMNANVTLHNFLQSSPKKNGGSFLVQKENEVFDAISVEKLNRNWDGWIQVSHIVCVSDNGERLKGRISTLFSIKLAPGQIYPVPFELLLDDALNESFSWRSVTFEVTLIDIQSNEEFTVQLKPENVPEEGEVEIGVEKKMFEVGFQLRNATWGDIYKVTFDGYDGAIQYVMVRPPANPCSNLEDSSHNKCPVIIALHGAGVEASSEFWTNALKQRSDCWILFPTGRTAWGFDWHGPSYKQIESSLEILAQDLPGVPINFKKIYEMDITKLIYTGHSNGGQGAWWLTSHFPENAVLSVPASGYIKMQMYVPYFLRAGDSYADPILRGILENSIAENDIDLHAENMEGIPILARTGSEDDNVPPIHSRRLIRMMQEISFDKFKANLSEILLQGHWFEGVLNDELIDSIITSSISDKSPILSKKNIEKFSLTALNPAVCGPKNGIRILQLQVPFRLGKIAVSIVENKMFIKTTNIRRFQFLAEPLWKYKRRNLLSRPPPGIWRSEIAEWHVDNTYFNSTPKIGPSYLNSDLQADTWTVSKDFLWISEERHFSTYGPASNVLSNPFVIVIPSNLTSNNSWKKNMYYKMAQLLALSWYVHARGGTQILLDSQIHDGDAARYNMIVLGGPLDNLWTRRREKENKAGNMVNFLENGRGFQIGKRNYTGPGVGIIFNAPNPTRTRLAIFLDGTDENGLAKAVWNVPFRAGMMVPDYLVFGEEYGDPSTGWTAPGKKKIATKGSGGILAAGYWSNHWEYDDRCGYLK
ncbi:hypothetical protein HDU92_001416 [Lobulomyces angularis]|nr:hypothetical protein HDU92_001416 [Lobulomyces angularis]